VSELNAAMLDSQEAAYGDGLDPEYRHKYMWAVKPHYFTPFYNWPYTFGLLFGIGLYAQYLDDPERFLAGYDDMLSTVGMADAATLAGRFGRHPGRAVLGRQLAVLVHHVDDYERLAGREPRRAGTLSAGRLAPGRTTPSLAQGGGWTPAVCPCSSRAHQRVSVVPLGDA
jgi:hypothetical protein